ncbi:MAG: IS1 family transposase [Treponema sp.]|jgi:insertion element IS1 protein InsB|nr:IS1 family transposase [Treponema sp.]
MVPVNEAETDQTGSFVGSKSRQYGLWWAIDHHSGEPLAFHFGTGEHKKHDEVLGLLKSFDIDIVYCDETFAYKPRVSESEVITGKEKTQKIERNHVSLRRWCSRLVRNGIGFSKEPRMHKMVVALVINFWFFLRIV